MTMLLNDNGVDTMAQQAADYSGLEQTIYRRGNGGYIFCAKGNFFGLKQALNPNEQVQYIKTIKPSNWPKEEK
jgi:hypothetical protein